MPTKEWHRKQRNDDIADLATIEGDEILSAAGREPDENGNWSTEDMDFLWNVCRERLRPVAK